MRACYVCTLRLALCVNRAAVVVHELEQGKCGVDGFHALHVTDLRRLGKRRTPAPVQGATPSGHPF